MGAFFDTNTTRETTYDYRRSHLNRQTTAIRFQKRRYVKIGTGLGPITGNTGNPLTIRITQAQDARVAGVPVMQAHTREPRGVHLVQIGSNRAGSRVS